MASLRIRIQLFISVSGSRKPNQCGSKRIRIWIRLSSHKKLSFYMKNIHKVGTRSKKAENQFFCKFWSISMLLDPDPHFQYGSGFTTQLVSACPVLLQGLPLRLPRREGQCLQTCPPGIDERIGAGLQDGRKRTFSCKGINTGKCQK